jgi:hypothetical protein
VGCCGSGLLACAYSSVCVCVLDIVQFVAGPSGVGYYIPEKVPSQEVDGIASLTATMMVCTVDCVVVRVCEPSFAITQFCVLPSQDKADLSIVNVIADEECDPGCTSPMLANDNLDAVFLYYGNAYVGRNGGITWTGDF